MFEELKAKFQFWKSKKFVTLHEDYEFFLDLSNHEAIAIKILKKYPGVIFEITNIHMSTDNNMLYDQSVISNPNLCNVESRGFKNFTAAIFRSIILNSIESAKKDKLNENRDLDLIELDAERTFHEEDVAISEKRVPNRKPRKKSVRANKRVHSKVQQSSANSSAGTQSSGVDETI